MNYSRELKAAIELLKSAPTHGTAERAGGAILPTASPAQQKGHHMEQHPLQYTPKVKSREHEIADDMTRRLKGDTLAIAVTREDAIVIIAALEAAK